MRVIVPASIPTSTRSRAPTALQSASRVGQTRRPHRTIRNVVGSQLRQAEGYPFDPTLERRWGVADNGDVYEVAVRPHLLGGLRRRWPSLGAPRPRTRRPEAVRTKSTAIAICSSQLAVKARRPTFATACVDP